MNSTRAGIYGLFTYVAYTVGHNKHMTNERYADGPPYPVAICGVIGYSTEHSLRTHIGPTRNSYLPGEMK